MQKFITMLILLVFVSFYFLCAQEKKDTNVVKTYFAKISYYGYKHNKRRTASGEIFNMDSLTAAHKKLKFGTRVRVTNLKTGKSVIVRINDRGPFIPGIEFDLAQQASFDIGNRGIAKCKIEILANK